MRDRLGHSGHDGGQYSTDDDTDGAGACPTLAAATRVDTALYLVAHRRRRDVLALLRARPGPVAAEVVVAHATERARARSEASRNAIVGNLLATQLPRLLASSLVELTDGYCRYAATGLADRVVAAVLDAERTSHDDPPETARYTAAGGPEEPR